MAFWNRWERPPSVAERRAQATRHLAAASRRGRPLAPIVIDGRKIATTFWGKAWCDNLERYQDLAYRLDRGRSYVRSGAVVDLAITVSTIEAQVLGSTQYRVRITIGPLAPARWTEIQRGCRGHIGSLVDLLAGNLSPTVMERLCARGTGMFPEPAAIAFTCSCPDYASVCKHVAATMYGVGARLDHDPALLFTLRGVSADELLATVVRDVALARPARSTRVLEDTAGLDALFGIDLAPAAPPPARAPRPATKPRRAPTKPTSAQAAPAKSTPVKAAPGARRGAPAKPVTVATTTRTKASKPGTRAVTPPTAPPRRIRRRKPS